ncbi:MAG: 16S rRNA (guanine(966)-N(2))-methyltransferase RsmD [Qingshengfaniella sp.]
MRIVGGAFRGRRLTALGGGDAAAHLRPTADRVREAVFNVLAGGALGDPLEDAVVLDLFAGTGGLGLEALSRGAKRVIFVDNGRKSLSILDQNIHLLDVADRARVIRTTALRLPPADTPASLIFLDPPYGKALGEKALAAAQVSGWIAPGAVIVWEEAAPQEAPTGFTLHGHRRYGDVHVTLLLAD